MQVQLNTRISVETMQALQEYRKANDISIAKVVEEALKQYLNSKEELKMKKVEIKSEVIRSIASLYAEGEDVEWVEGALQEAGLTKEQSEDVIADTWTDDDSYQSLIEAVRKYTTILP